MVPHLEVLRPQAASAKYLGLIEEPARMEVSADHRPSDSQRWWIL